MPDDFRNGCGPDTETVQLSVLLHDLSDELNQLAGQCASLQETISTLLGKVNHPDLGAEIHMLQDVDRVQQTLSDIAGILNATHPASCGISVRREAIGGAILLESLRQRLGLSNDPLVTADDPDDTDITWL